MTKKIIFLQLVFALIFTVNSSSEIITLNNGEQIKGGIVEQTDYKLRIALDSGVIVTYYMDEINNIEKNPQPNPAYTPTHTNESTSKKTYYTNGNVLREFNNGLVTTYYLNGNIFMEENYRDGKLEGMRVVYDEDGKVRRKSQFRNGLLNGVDISFYENGNMKWADNYIDDELVGISKYYYSDGSLFSEKSYNDVKDGTAKIYDRQGNIIQELAYKKGFLFDADSPVDGIFTIKYDNGNIHSERKYIKGNPIDEKVFYEDGTLASEINGVDREYYATGQLKVESVGKDNCSIYDRQGNVIFDSTLVPIKDAFSYECTED